jgi:hypothetical protein
MHLLVFTYIPGVPPPPPSKKIPEYATALCEELTLYVT